MAVFFQRINCNMQNLIRQISQREDFINKPPVLIDVGASGGLNPVWQKIASFSILIAFDPDEREFGYIEQKGTGYKRNYVFKSIATSETGISKKKFYLTKSPYCSSTLRPLNHKLKGHHFSDSYEIEKEIELTAVNIQDALDKLKLEYVDWFKTDTQGTDLRLFKSLKESISNNVLVAEFEPGIIDSYEGEDKLTDVLKYMESLNFYLTSLNVKGPLKIDSNHFNQIFNSSLKKRLAGDMVKKVPGWAEIIYANSLSSNSFTQREYILSWLFHSLQGHHGIAFSLIQDAKTKQADALYPELEAFSLSKIKSDLYSLRGIARMLSRMLNKYLS